MKSLITLAYSLNACSLLLFRVIARAAAVLGFPFDAFHLEEAAVDVDFVVEAFFAEAFFAEAFFGGALFIRDVFAAFLVFALDTPSSPLDTVLLVSA